MGSDSCLRVKAIDPANMKRTAKNKLLPQSQRNRLQIRRSQKSKSTCLKVTEIDLHKKSTAKIKFATRSSKSTSPKQAPKKGKNQNPKESLKTEGQKAIPYNHESKTTIAIQTILAINFLTVKNHLDCKP